VDPINDLRPVCPNCHLALHSKKIGCPVVFLLISLMYVPTLSTLKLYEMSKRFTFQCVVYKLDRLGRSTKRLIELSDELQDRGIELVSIRDRIDTTTAVGKAMFRMLVVLSEMERDLISERTRAGLESARARGRSGGRPKKDKKDIEKALKLYDTEQCTVKEIEEMTSVSKATLYREIRKRKSEKKIV
jgi:DNA invertase Pin-like site-specific DNA recombinase